MMSSDSPAVSEFDFDAYKEAAVSQYRSLRPTYEQLAEVAKRILNDTLHVAGIGIHSIEARAKSLESFAAKTAKVSESNPTKPKYTDPLGQITDLAGVRVITFLPRTVEQVCEHIEREFTVLERTDKAAELMDEGKFGYQSIHFLVQMHPDRVRLAEYQRYKALTFEIQVRTILQHTWAEMEHDIQYKSAAVIPAVIRRKFVALAGLLEIADREFQALQDEDEQLRRRARESVQQGKLTTVEITPDALKSYLDRKLGADGRMTGWSYNFTANLVRRLGFENLSRVDDCITGYDDDRVSRAMWGSRQGQLSRFEDILLAGMGEYFISRHPWAREDSWANDFRQRLDRLRKAGIPIGSYDPGAHETSKR
jgi:ppGpp synthetase/RelA/SpoT-type nucleotidyltranferase